MADNEADNHKVAAAAVEVDPAYNDFRERIERAILEDNIATVREIIEAGFKYKKEQQSTPRLLWQGPVVYQQELERLIIQASHFPGFLNSIARGRIEMVTLLLKAEPDLDCMSIYGYGTLQLAAAIRDKDTRWSMVKLLMEAGAKVVNEGTKYTTTCVHQAVAANDFDLVKYFLDAGAHLNCLDSYGHSLFHSAYSFIPGDDALFGMIKRLTEAGANINLLGRKGSTFLHYVCGSLSCPWELVKLLLDLGAELNILNENNVSPLALAARSGNLELVKNMIQAGADVNISKKCTGSPLQLAVSECNKNIVELLLESGADIKAEDEDGKNILTYAAGISNSLHLRAFEQLVLDGQENFLKEKTIEYQGILKMIINFGLSMTSTKTGVNLPFQSVLRGGNLEAFHLFLEKGVQLETCKVQFPLHLAASNYHQQIMENLLDRHLYDVDDVDDKGVTPLYIAARYRHCVSLFELIKAGADVNAVCEEIISKDPHETTKRAVLSEAIVTGMLQEFPEYQPYLVEEVLDALGDSKIVDILFCAGASMNSTDVHHACQMLIDSAKSNLIVDVDSEYLDKMMECIIKQIVLLESQGRFVDPNLKKSFLELDNYPDYFVQCSNELELLKTVFMYGDITLYHLLTGKDTTYFISNQRVVENFKSLDLNEDFKIYGFRLSKCFSLAEHKRKLMNVAKCVLNELLVYRFDNFGMILHNIMVYLPFRDMINLCQMRFEKESDVTL